MYFLYIFFFLQGISCKKKNDVLFLHIVLLMVTVVVFHRLND